MIQFNINDIVENNVSPRLRKTFTLVFFKCCVFPLVTLYDQFYTFYNAKRYELLFNGQVIYLEHLLNDQFDNVNREIYITDAPQVADEVVLFNEAEQNEETVLYNESEGEQPIVLYNESEYQYWPDFIVHVPSTVAFDEPRMRAYLDKYKLASKNYEIKIV